jgi:predicted phage tail protein
MKVVKVYGALRELLGKTRFEFVADTPAQAMRALLVNFPQLEQWLIDSEKNGVAYRVTVGKQKINEQDVSGMFLPWSEQDVFSIAPVMTGAGSTTQIILGAALLAVAIVNPFGAAAIGTLGITAPILVNTAVGVLGATLLLGGVAQAISPVPKPPGPADAPTELESNSFSGIVNTNRQGVPVPIAYGRVFVGSAVISAGLDVDQV